MQRGSDRLSRHRDDEMKHELQGLLRSGHPTRSEEWNDPEPTADDDPQVWGGPVAPGSEGASLETVRLELARLLGRPEAELIGTVPGGPAGTTVDTTPIMFTATGKAKLISMMSTYKTPFNVIVGSTLTVAQGQMVPEGKLDAVISIRAHAGL